MGKTIAAMCVAMVLAACGEGRPAPMALDDAGGPTCDPATDPPRAPTCAADAVSCASGWVLTCPGLDGPVRFACSGGGAPVCISDTLAMASDATCARRWCLPDAG